MSVVVSEMSSEDILPRSHFVRSGWSSMDILSLVVRNDLLT